jgi:hypothetical protein
MRHAHAAALLFALVLAAPARAQAPDATTAADQVLRQLDAFRRNDYDAAYAMASVEIHSLFDRRAFEQMVRTGYPEIAECVRARVAERRAAPDGRVLLLMKILGANGNHVEAVYEMVWEADAWKVNGVVAQPDPGEEARAPRRGAVAA